MSETTATVLVRRGLDEPDAARGFLAAEAPAHDPHTLGDMAVAVERIRAAVAAGERICVHGDYDVDGISATAVAVLVLRELGANVEWRLPSRFEEGYGLAAETIERLAEDGVDLVLTVDCGITAVDEVRRAQELGLDVIVTTTTARERRCRTVPSSPPGRRPIRASTCVEPESCTRWPVRCSEATTRPSPVSSTSSRWRRSPTSSRSSTRTARSRRPGSAPWPAPAVPASRS